MFEMTTVNAEGTGWVDSSPGDEMTGYMAQNTSAEAARSGVDTVHVIANSDDTVTLKAGGTIDENGVLYTLKEDMTIAVSRGSISDAGIMLDTVVGSTDRTPVIIIFNTASFVPEKNGWYVGQKRVLNSAIYRGTSLSSLMIVDKSFNGSTYDTQATKNPFSFVPFYLLKYSTWKSELFRKVASSFFDNRVSGSSIGFILTSSSRGVGSCYEYESGGYHHSGIRCYNFNTDTVTTHEIINQFGGSSIIFNGCTSDMTNTVYAIGTATKKLYKRLITDPAGVYSEYDLSSFANSITGVAWTPDGFIAVADSAAKKIHILNSTSLALIKSVSVLWNPKNISYVETWNGKTIFAITGTLTSFISDITKSRLLFAEYDGTFMNVFYEIPINSADSVSCCNPKDYMLSVDETTQSVIVK